LESAESGEITVTCVRVAAVKRNANGTEKKEKKSRKWKEWGSNRGEIHKRRAEESRPYRRNGIDKIKQNGTENSEEQNRAEQNGLRRKDHHIAAAKNNTERKIKTEDDNILRNEE
jgi:hypothetical protein